jgi:hypothetical protein
MLLVAKLVIGALLVLMCAIATLAIVAYNALRHSKEGDITEILPKLFNPLGISVGIQNQGGWEWDLLISKLEK